MRKFERQIKQVESDVLVETTCDLCGTVASSGEWESSAWEVNEVELEVTVRQKDGTSYPEGGYGTDYTVDMCPSCFKNKLIPWLKSQGCKTERKDWSW